MCMHIIILSVNLTEKIEPIFSNNLSMTKKTKYSYNKHIPLYRKPMKIVLIIFYFSVLKTFYKLNGLLKLMKIE